VTLNFAETLVVKSRPSVPHGANLFLSLYFVLLYLVYTVLFNEVRYNVQYVISQIVIKMNDG